MFKARSSPSIGPTGTRAIGSRRISADAAVIALVAAAFAIRLVWLVAFGGREIEMDGAEYARIADNLRHGLGYLGIQGHVDVVFPPLYPLLIAALTPFVHTSEHAGVALEVIMGSLLVLPVYGIARMAFGPRAAAYAGAIIALSPMANRLSTSVLSDSTFLVLASSGIFFALRGLRGRGVLDFAACGLAYGLAFDTRPEAVAMVVVISVAIAANRLFERRAAAAGAALTVIAVPFVLCALPYIVSLSAWNHHLTFQGKTDLNYAIGKRVQRGMTYWQAADEIDASGNAIGAELNASEPANQRVAEPKSAYAVYLLRNAARHARDLTYQLLTSVYDRGILLALAFVGFAFSRFDRARLRDESILLAYGIALYAALCSVTQFWDRYADGFIPLLAVWGGAGCAAISTRIEAAAPRSRWAPFGFALAFAAVFGGLYVFAGMRGRPEALDTTKRQAGTYLAHTHPAPRIMEFFDLAAFYSGATWYPLPYGTSSAALRYIAGIDPNYVVLESDAEQHIPYLAGWIRHGIPDRRATFVDTFSSRSRELKLFRWHGTPRSNALQGKA